MEWNPIEVMLLVRGLPERSRFMARVQGEKNGGGWSTTDWLLLDIRNCLESLRVMKAVSGSKNASQKAKQEFREWDFAPGASERKRRKTQSKLDSLSRLAGRSKFSSVE